MIIPKKKLRVIKPTPNIIKKQKYREVTFSSARDFMKFIDLKIDDVYNKMSVYMLILSIRDLTYKGNNKYMNLSRKKSIAWFKQQEEKHPFGFGMICLYLNINADRLWLQLRRWFKVDPEYLGSILKGVEARIFDGHRNESVRRRVRNEPRIDTEI